MMKLYNSTYNLNIKMVDEIKNGVDFTLFIKNLDVPILDIGNKCGITGYIDFITDDYLTNNIMKGTDCHGRLFVVLKVDAIIGKSNNNDNDESNDNDDIRQCLVQTFFQRYTDNEYIWMGAGQTNNIMIDTVGGMKSSHFNFIKNIITNNGGYIFNKDRLYRRDEFIVKYVIPTTTIPRIKSANTYV